MWSIDLPLEFNHFGEDNPSLRMWRKFSRTQSEELKTIDAKDMTFSHLAPDTFRVLSSTGEYSFCECRSTREQFYCNDSCLWVDYCWYCNQFGCCKLIGAPKATLNAIVSRYPSKDGYPPPLLLDSLDDIREPLKEIMATAVNAWTIHAKPRY